MIAPAPRSDLTLGAHERENSFRLLLREAKAEAACAGRSFAGNLTRIKADRTGAGENDTKKMTLESATPAGSVDAEARLANFANRRLAREWQTIESMIRIYCRARHHTQGLCPECSSLMSYANLRLERCRFGAGKPTCANCPVHCYQRARREQIRIVMRYAGPRMLWRHPLLSLRHWLDGFREAPPVSGT